MTLSQLLYLKYSERFFWREILPLNNENIAKPVIPGCLKYGTALKTTDDGL